MVEESTTQLFTVDEQEKAALAREAYLRGDFQGEHIQSFFGNVSEGT